MSVSTVLLSEVPAVELLSLDDLKDCRGWADPEWRERMISRLSATVGCEIAVRDPRFGKMIRCGMNVLGDASRCPKHGGPSRIPEDVRAINVKAKDLRRLDSEISRVEARLNSLVFKMREEYRSLRSDEKLLRELKIQIVSLRRSLSKESGN